MQENLTDFRGKTLDFYTDVILFSLNIHLHHIKTAYNRLISVLISSVSSKMKLHLEGELDKNCINKNIFFLQQFSIQTIFVSQIYKFL